MQAGKDIAVLDSLFYAKFSKDGYKGVCRWYKDVSKIAAVEEHSKFVRMICMCR